MISFASYNQQSELTFQEYLKSRLETERERAAIKNYRFLKFLSKKKLAVQSAAKSLNSLKILEEKIFFFHDLNYFIYTMYNIIY